MQLTPEGTEETADRPGHSLDPEGPADHHGLAAQLGGLARSINQESPDAILEIVVQAAIELIPGTEEASFSIVTNRQNVESRAPSCELPLQLDALQRGLGEGPCLDSIYRETTIRVPNMATEERWPRFAQQAAEAGVASMLAFQLYVEGSNLGALNLYSGQPEAFTSESEHIGWTLASHAAIALAEAQKVDQLHQAVESRDVIGQAKGILMERYKITSHQAFLLLAKASSNTNQKLHAIAETLVNTGEVNDEN